jgi:hypothetical protein
MGRVFQAHLDRMEADRRALVDKVLESVSIEMRAEAYALACSIGDDLSYDGFTEPSIRAAIVCAVEKAVARRASAVRGEAA